MGKGSYQVIISARALQDLEEIVRFIAIDNPPAAERFGQRLVDEAQALAGQPLTGWAVP
jgi:toxin ParE1/3/4